MRRVRSSKCGHAVRNFRFNSDSLFMLENHTPIILRLIPLFIYNVLLQFDGGVTATLIYDGYGYFDDRKLIEGDGLSGDKQLGPGQRLRKARAEGKLNKDTPMGSLSMMSVAGPKFHVRSGAARLRSSWKIFMNP
jgi:hypothetical protein